MAALFRRPVPLKFLVPALDAVYVAVVGPRYWCQAVLEALGHLVLVSIFDGGHVVEV